MIIVTVAHYISPIVCGSLIRSQRVSWRSNQMARLVSSVEVKAIASDAVLLLIVITAVSTG